MVIKRIAIISDTHSKIREAVIGAICDCDALIHAGDIADIKTVRAFIDIMKDKPVHFVRGNADKYSKEALLEGASLSIPKDATFTLAGYSFYLVHNIKMMDSLVRPDFVVYGHTHRYRDDIEDGIHYLNPGCCGPRRPGQPVTLMILEIDDVTGEYKVNKVDVSSDSTGTKTMQERDMYKSILAIVKDMDRGRPVANIVKRHGLSEDMVNKILQIYTTHPGIDVYGIMDRLDIWGL